MLFLLLLLETPFVLALPLFTLNISLSPIPTLLTFIHFLDRTLKRLTIFGIDDTLTLVAFARALPRQASIKNNFGICNNILLFSGVDLS